MINKIKSPDELLKLQEQIKAGRDPNQPCVTICAGTGCLALGAKKIIAAFKDELARQGLENKVQVRETGCPGFCEKGPIVVLAPDEITYLRVAIDDVPEIISKTIVKKELIERLVYTDSKNDQKYVKESDIPFYKKQKRLLLGNNNNIDPRNIEDYLAVGGYSAASKALFQASPESIIEEITKAKLRGRGGAGFPTGVKWDTTRKVNDFPKYIVCNADEGDPGAFMDRALLEGNPHSVLEGMIIGAFAIGANHGYIYVRNEYPLAVENATIAVEKAQEFGLLGKNIMGSGFDFEIKIIRGGGSFVCGEETALIKSIEGDPGEPKAKPPYPAIKGLWGKPTNINNVETWANVPLIINKGADWYQGIGTKNSKGTKIFSLVGKINNTGLVEVPMGITLREIVFEIGGGIPNGRKFKAVQTGGPSGGCIPKQFLDMPIDYDELVKIGSIMGSGGMIVMDDHNCMVDVAKYFLGFLEEESCGKCTPCREGIRQMKGILTRITEGEGREEDIETLEWMGQAMKDFALCGLGKTAANSVLSTLRYFRDEYERHIKDKRCDAMVCKKLTGPQCQAACPVDTEPWRYAALIEKGDYAGAYQVIRAANPFPAVCGRVCDRKCESRCTLGAGGGEALAIRSLKRFVTDHQMKNGDIPVPKIGPAKGKRVAVIGGGPSGMACAMEARIAGYDVTIFERHDKLGGMLYWGIPSYRLPKDILDRETSVLEKIGVKVRYNVRVGKDISLKEIHDQFDAVYIGVGAQGGRKLGIPNENAAGVMSGVEFLRSIAKNQQVSVGNRVMVVGGGNVAADVALTAKRIGAKEIYLACLERREEMPASTEEIEQMLEEGIRIHNSWGPQIIHEADGKVKKITFKHCTSVFDDEGRFNPVYKESLKKEFSVDTIILAIGQSAETTSLAGPEGLEMLGDGWIKSDPVTFQTTIKGIFAGGDAVTGPNTVVDAIAAGRQAAESIDRFLNNQELIKPASLKLPDFFIEPAVLEGLEIEQLNRAEPPSLALSERVSNFDEVTMALSEEAARLECRRCLRCDLEFTREKH